MSTSAVTAEISDPYAQALISLAKDQGLTDRFGEEATAMVELLRDSEELQRFLASPLMSAEVKKAVLQQVAGEGFHPMFVNFLKLLIDRGRVLFLAPVLKQYQVLLRQFKQTVLADVTTAIPLTEAQQAEVRDKVLALTGAREVELSITLDSALLGGVIIQVGSQVVDASLRGQLRRLGIELSAGA